MQPRLFLRAFLRSWLVGAALFALGNLAGIGLAGENLPESGPDPAYAVLDRAYTALNAKDYDRAIAGFAEAIGIAPKRVSVYKDLAYSLLKVGENVAARDRFEEAMRLDPADEHVAMEYAFLCYETGKPVEARRVFDRLRKTGNPTAIEAFENIDRPLREGIARWSEAVEQSPNNFSAHEELARLARQRDALDLSAEHYEKAWRLRRDRRDLLLELGQIWTEQERPDQAMSALLAASRGGEPRVADLARELLPARYPYVYEFEDALELDPSNEELRRELAYLHRAMGNPDAAEREFELLPERAPTPPAKSSPPRLLLRNEVPAAPSAKMMAERSLEKGYLNDALRYLQVAHEDDPTDFDVMYWLGQAYNTMAGLNPDRGAALDREAMRWFELASQSPDAFVSDGASRAYDNLAPAYRRFRTTFWAFPMISTRWRDTFAYAQTKVELNTPRFWVHPYLSVRFIGDLRGRVQTPGTNQLQLGNLGAMYLSQRSAILAAGIATPVWHGLGGWFEAGEALRYMNGPGRAATPDFRGGLTFAKGFGEVLAPGRHGWFAETNADAVFVSRFANDTILYSQNRAGWTFAALEGFDNFHAQVYWNGNFTSDSKRQYWANTAETGPGFAFRMSSLPKGMLISVNFLKGRYLLNEVNPLGRRYNDVRIGFWYAFTK